MSTGVMVLDIADAIVTMLNAQSFSQAFTAVRKHLPKYNREELGTLRVSVVPASVSYSGAEGTRAEYQEELGVSVGVQKAFGEDASEESAEFDDYMLLVQEIIDYLKNNHVETTTPNALVIGVENEPVYSMEHINEMRVFTSPINVTYRLWRS